MTLMTLITGGSDPSASHWLKEDLLYVLRCLQRHLQYPTQLPPILTQGLPVSSEGWCFKSSNMHFATSYPRNEQVALTVPLERFINLGLLKVLGTCLWTSFGLRVFRT